ncbi:site-specific integrase [Acuticoccus sediminis]|uniref:Site-specific integrase n=1 Tax=Acuticoccus sediminis TaxID=2184697 RepID=A0A8B2NRY0_9HYPH|nr:site-specific integrase [Acuticoccus sediminis]RAH99871.1 site-specific integrase [Acuticoccus sediminis]
MSVRKRIWTSKGVEKTAWVVDYTDQNGKRRLKTFQRKKEADAWAARTTTEVGDGIHVADRATVTVSEAGDKWLESAINAGLERSTTDQYRQHLKLHIKPFLGERRLNELTVPVIRDWQDRLRNEGRSAKMVRIVTASLGRILSEAQDRGLVVRNAVSEMSRRRKVGARTEDRQTTRLAYGEAIPTQEEIRAIVTAASGRYRPVLITAIFTGLRASELRGLRWSDVELDKAKLHVRQRASLYKAIGAPKSKAGQRTVPLPPVVVNTLREWKVACPKGKLGLVFPNGAGNIEEHGNIVKRGLWPAQIAAGVVRDTGEKDDDGNPILGPRYTGLHSLRHWYASWLINRRADGGLELSAKAVQERLGHASVALTLNTYSHLFPSQDEADALAAAELSLLGNATLT